MGPWASHNLAGIQPSNWASFIPSNGPFVLMLCWAKAKAKMAPLLHKPTCLKMHILTYYYTQRSLLKILVQGFFEFFFICLNEANMDANSINIIQNFYKAVFLKEITLLRN